MKLDILFHYNVDETTGEITYIGKEEIKVDTDKVIAKKSEKVDTPKDSDSEPKLYLEDNKCRLNSSALTLMNVNAGDKIDIKYESVNGNSIPIIGTDESFGTKGGTKLTKTGTFSYRGSKNELLSKRGSEFKLTSHSSKNGIFVLNSTSQQEPLKGDENVKTDEIDLDLSDLIDDEDTKIQSIDSNFFKL